jgi:hypothetical protein
VFAHELMQLSVKHRNRINDVISRYDSRLTGRVESLLLLVGVSVTLHFYHR